MPFTSSSQMRGAFSGALGPVMKAKAPTWAKETPNLKALPKKAKMMMTRQAMLAKMKD